MFQLENKQTNKKQKNLHIMGNSKVPLLHFKETKSTKLNKVSGSFNLSI